jgi:hypothetical protein
MSYILDALKKAAEQRSGPPLEVRRLLMPAPVPAASRRRYVAIAAIAGGVITLAAVLWIWIPTHDAPSPATPPVASVTPAPIQSAAPPAASATPPTATPQTATATPPAVTAAPHAAVPEERPRVAVDKKPRVPLVPVESKSDSTRTSGGDARSAATNVRPAETTPARTTPPAAPVPGPIVSLLPPTAAPAGATRTDTGKLKVEVIVYSEERPLRWAFISGRRYVEGDAIGDGARVEEIQSNGVVIVEDGRRITLRP